MMYEPVHVSTANAAAQSLYAKLQKLSEDIQLQHSIITAQKESVLKSRQKTFEVQKVEPTGDSTHMVHTHAGTVMQHRAMIIKHYELIQQHKQMVKEQGLHVQNLTSTLLNIQQETNVVDELMTTKMAESKSIDAPPTTTLTITDGTGNGKTKRRKSKRISANIVMDDNYSKISPDINVLEPCIESVAIDELENEKVTTITTTTTSTTTTTTPTSTTTETTTISSVTTPTATTTTAMTTTTTTTTSAPPSPLPCDLDIPLPLSP